MKAVRHNVKGSVSFRVLKPPSRVSFEFHSMAALLGWTSILQCMTHLRHPNPADSIVHLSSLLNMNGNIVKEQLHGVDGNSTCADCGSVEPSWCTMNNGGLICTQCSGVHRLLGVEVRISIF